MHNCNGALPPHWQLQSMITVLSDSRQAVEHLLRDVVEFGDRWDGNIASLDLPPGLSADVIARAEDLVLDWKHSAEYRAVPLVMAIYEMITAGSVWKTNDDPYASHNRTPD